MDVLEKLFEESSTYDPDAEAVIEHGESGHLITSVADFRRLVRVIAGAIEKRCSSDDRVAILLPQSSKAYCAEIAALYCGRVFCPLEQAYPIERITHCLQDLQPKLIITDRAGAEQVASLKMPIMNVDEVDGPEAGLRVAGERAYIIYTSGSTGLPKGVLVSRRSMNRFLEWSSAFYQVRRGDRWAQFSSLGFDLSLVDLLTCLPSGGTLVPVSSRLDRMLPGRFVKDFGISIWHSVPSVIPLLLDGRNSVAEQLQTLRLVSFCGEPLYPQQVTSLISPLPNLKVVNTYGPTEGTFFCSAQIVDQALCDRTTGSSLPIGQPIPGWAFEFAAVDEDASLKELIIVSEYISSGYISPTPDQARFVDSAGGNRSYKTGDLVRCVGEQVFFAQRADNQVKIRGNRLDLTEVEYQALNAGVSEAKAFLHDGSLFLAIGSGGSREAAEVRQYLEKHLPNFAVPADILILDPLPRNANSKVDVNVLRALVTDKWKTADGEK